MRCCSYQLCITEGSPTSHIHSMHNCYVLHIHAGSIHDTDICVECHSLSSAMTSRHNELTLFDASIAIELCIISQFSANIRTAYIICGQCDTHRYALNKKKLFLCCICAQHIIRAEDTQITCNNIISAYTDQIQAQ